MILVACAIIENSEKLVLVTQRSETMSLPLKWEFPGGKVEANESYAETAVREIKEELNIDISVKTKLKEVIYHYPNFSITLIPFVCDNIQGEIILHEHYAFRWLSPNNLLDLDWAAADIPIVQQYLDTL